MSTQDSPKLRERVVAAAGASVTAALIVNPLDVIKVRMQAQAASCSVNQVQSSRLLIESWAVSSCPVCEAPAQLARTGCATAGPVAYRGMWDAARQIVKQEGISVLWRGSQASLLLAVPMVGIHMPVYDYLTTHFQPVWGSAAPVIAGGISRASAVFACAPLELLRTRIYANVALGPGAAASAASAAAAAPAAGGLLPLVRNLGSVPQMWTGFTATMARDVPFSMLYWGMVEPIRGALLRPLSQPSPPLPSAAVSAATAAAAHTILPTTAVDPDSARLLESSTPTTSNSNTSEFQSDVTSSTTPTLNSSRSTSTPVTTSRPSTSGSDRYAPHELLLANMAAGGFSGGLAAAITTPLDVVKTRQQIAKKAQQASDRIWPLLQRIYQQEGLQGLYRGVAPRSARAAPACAIVISVYELLKNAMLQDVPALD